MLFKPEYKSMILEGRKTATRRMWNRPLVKVRGIYKAQLRPYSNEYFAEIKIVKLFKQKLCDMSEEDAKKEGYNSIKDFQNAWIKINNVQWNPETEPYVIEFELVK